MSIVYDSFIPENVAPPDVKEIAVYDSKGNKKGIVTMNTAFHPSLGERQYSFGAISDVHLGVDTSEDDFKRALEFIKERSPKYKDRVVICGDLTNNGNDEQFASFKEILNNITYKNYTTGNHDTYTYGKSIVYDLYTHLGNVPYGTTTMGTNDILIKLPVESEGASFSTYELQMFYESLEENRNKRCFVFMHYFIGNGNYDVCGNAHGMYNSHAWSTEEGQTQMEVFESLLRHYKNTVWFHGHSHLSFKFQEGCTYANYDESRGYRSVHIPSITNPRVADGSDEDTQPDYNYAGSEGYLVDVYENGILLRGRDFANGEWLPIATYWIDTTLQTVEAGTYTDPTGTITT